MHRFSDRTSDHRLRWFAQLTNDIDRAQKLAWKLGVVEGDNTEAKRLYAQLEAIRLEVDALRFQAWVDVRDELDLSGIYDQLGRNVSA